MNKIKKWDNKYLKKINKQVERQKTISEPIIYSLGKP